MLTSFLRWYTRLLLVTTALVIVPNLSIATCLEESSVNEKIECLETKLEALNSIPQQAIVAFASQSCPEGWRIYSQAKGRMIIGVGQGSGLTDRYLNQKGGNETHTLTISELPPHSHQVSTGKADTTTGGTHLPFIGTNGGPWNTNSVGGSQPHDNMPPFVVLTICEKQ